MQGVNPEIDEVSKTLEHADSLVKNASVVVNDGKGAAATVTAAVATGGASLAVPSANLGERAGLQISDTFSTKPKKKLS